MCPLFLSALGPHLVHAVHAFSLREFIGASIMLVKSSLFPWCPLSYLVSGCWSPISVGYGFNLVEWSLSQIRYWLVILTKLSATIALASLASRTSFYVCIYVCMHFFLRQGFSVALEPVLWCRMVSVYVLLSLVK